jgi:predicted amidohydrolase
MYDLPAMSAEFVAAAEPLDGQWVSGIRALASELRVAIVVGLVETSADPGKAFNTLLLVGPDGNDLAVYRKQHLYDAFGYRESEYICAGPLGAPPVVEIGDVSVALATCYDLRFPEVARLAADAGAELIVYPASWVPGPRKEDHWKVLARARAIENTVFTAGVGQAPPMGIGSSLITDPSGLVVGELGESSSALLVREIDPRRVSEVRLTNPSLANRRYQITTPT